MAIVVAILHSQLYRAFAGRSRQQLSRSLQAYIICNVYYSLMALHHAILKKCMCVLTSGEEEFHANWPNAYANSEKTCHFVDHCIAEKSISPVIAVADSLSCKHADIIQDVTAMMATSSQARAPCGLRTCCLGFSPRIFSSLPACKCMYKCMYSR
jgi:hypothetical protein